MRALPLLFLLSLCLHCSGGEAPKPKPALTQREKDSILAASKIPNAGAVGHAMRVADSTSAQVRSTDTIAP